MKAPHFNTKLPCQKPMLSMTESATFPYETSLSKTNVKTNWTESAKWIYLNYFIFFVFENWFEKELLWKSDHLTLHLWILVNSSIISLLISSLHLLKKLAILVNIVKHKFIFTVFYNTEPTLHNLKGFVKLAF